ncbi:phosphoribosyltransferase family protein [Paraconexibacter sp.]|uniref:phosphoribosyltransferase family protein n=1 Tax=Paraconexibacter sp. TaxID=2949640 RepID=UPI0035619958
MAFTDRRHAGRALAERVRRFAGERPVVVALPRGGVPVGFEVARELAAPLEILAVRKLGAPGNPELAVGAIAENGSFVLDAAAAERTGMTQTLLDATVDREARELRRRQLSYRHGRPGIEVRDRTVIVVDDGLATGLTMLAAVRSLRATGAARIIVAVPVGAPETVAYLSEEADEVVCHTTPDDLRGVGLWYRDFAPVSDAEVLSLLANAPHEPVAAEPPVTARGLRLPVAGATLTADLTVPHAAHGLVVFAHGSGSSRLSPRNRAVAAGLNEAGFGTLLVDLLTEEEAAERATVFDVALLASRLGDVTRWARNDPATHGLAIAYFGASTGAAAALHAAADASDVVRAVVSRGGRPDLAGDHLARVRAPTLLIVGSRDRQVLELNRDAAEHLTCPNRLVEVDGATHLFEEPGTLERVGALAADWFATHLGT